MTPKLKDRLTKVKTYFNFEHPFYAFIQMSTEFESRTDIPTAATDGYKQYFNEEWCDTLTNQELVFVVGHETLHQVYLHMTRRGNRDPFLWNIACDKTINQILKNAKIGTMPKGCFDQAGAEKFSAEELYEQEKKNKAKNPNGYPKELWDQVLDAFGKGMTEAERSQMEGAFKTKIKQAAEVAKAMGKLPAEMERFVDEVLNPKIGWEEELWDFMTQATARDDYSWKRPNRRYEDVYLPYLNSPSAGIIAEFTDTSGSMGNDCFKAFMGELNEIFFKIHPQKIIHIPCDATCYGMQEFTAADLPLQPKEVKFTGGGGTDFRPPFDLLESEGIVPECAIYFTDMMGTFPNKPPSYPVLWVSTTKGSEAPWGKTIYLDLTK